MALVDPHADTTRNEINAHRFRELLLSSDRSGRLARELWSSNGYTYTAHRRYISAFKSTGRRLGAVSPAGPPLATISPFPATPGQPSTAAATLIQHSASSAAELQSTAHGSPTPYQQLYSYTAVSSPPADSGDQHHDSQQHTPAVAAPAAEYAFEGVSHVLDSSKSPITAMCFAKVNAELLAFANSVGQLWISRFGPGGQVDVQEAQRMHHKSISGLDWSFDSSQLLTVGEDGAICLFDAATGVCLRSIIDFHAQVAMTCCRLHLLNSTLALVGTSSGQLEIYNCNSGKLYQRYAIGSAWEKDVGVSAVECDNHAVYVGDSHGNLHMFRSHMSGTSLTRLVWTCKIKTCSNKQSPLLHIQTLPFCLALDAPGIVTFCLDSTLSIIKAGAVPGALELLHLPYLRYLELHCKRILPPSPRPVHPAICPLSLITQPLPLITAGAEDSNVYIYDMSAPSGRVGTLNTLRGHSAPVTEVAWSFDEARLASASTDGTVILWKRGGA